MRFWPSHCTNPSTNKQTIVHQQLLPQKSKHFAFILRLRCMRFNELTISGAIWFSWPFWPLWFIQLNFPPNLLCLFYWLAKTTLDTKCHASNSKNKDLQYNGTFILPDYGILMIQSVKWGKKWLSNFYRLAKTMLDTKFHASKSKNKDLQYNGTFILPDYGILMI